MHPAASSKQRTQAQVINHDVLLEIFSWNVPWEMPDGTLTRPGQSLSILRRGSHVCRNWRNVLLDSPSLWAQCIDLDSLRHVSPPWRDLVLRRTKTSPLTVTGRASSANPATDLVWYLLKRLEEDWQRMRNVTVTVHITGNSLYESYLTRMWHVLRRPTNTLWLFSLDIQLARTPSILPSLCLFSHHSPSLKALSLNVSYSQFPITITSPLRSLRTLYLTYERRGVGDAELLGIFTSTPLLEHLTLRLWSITHTDTNLRPFVPRVKFIDIKSDGLEIYPAFLDRITPDPGCQLRLLNHTFEWHRLPEHVGLEKVECAWRTIRRYLDLLFSHQNTELPDLRIKLSFRHILLTSSSPYPFELSWETGGPQFYRKVLQVMFRTLSMIAYPRKITQLEFLHSFPLPFLPDADHLLGLLHSMSSITSLVANHTCLIYLRDIVAREEMFPFLETVVLHGNGDYVGRIEDVMPFLVHRYKTTPVKRLDLTATIHQVDDVYRVLDNLPGLELIWFPEMPSRTETYVCGSGDPQNTSRRC